MRVLTRQNLWHQGDVYPAGSLIELSDELASQLISGGLAESVEPVQPAPSQECEPVACEAEPPKKQARRCKK
jgi:hypothetical protein